MNLFEVSNARVQNFNRYTNPTVIVDIKREDFLHPEVSGNKLRKLNYNLQYALEQDLKTIITFGGAFSNHIAAAAAACQVMDLKCIGVIRGEELGTDLDKTLNSNPTLRLAHEKGMEFIFLSRKDYQSKELSSSFQILQERYPSSYLIPEGGTNTLAVKGCSEILNDYDLNSYSHIAVAGGTGGTAAGIIESSDDHQTVLVFSALKGDFLKQEIMKFTSKTNFKVFPEDRFGGYAKSTDDLIAYMNVRFRESGIPLDPIYTGKMMYRIDQMVSRGYFPDKTRILAIHTGGLQGIHGYNDLLRKKERPILEYEDHI